MQIHRIPFTFLSIPSVGNEWELLEMFDSAFCHLDMRFLAENGSSAASR